YGPLPKVPPVGSASALAAASTEACGASPCATIVVRDRARSSRPVPGPPAVSPVVRHQENPSSALAARDSTGLALDVAFPTAGQPLLVPGRSASSTVPGLRQNLMQQELEPTLRMR